MPAETKAGGILASVAALFGIEKEKPPAQQDVIPPGAPLYGMGPDFVNDSEPAPTTIAGDPWAPEMGKTQPTHQQVGAQALGYGDPRPEPTEPAPYWRKRDADDAQRHSVQIVDGDGWATPVNDYPQIAVYSRGSSPLSDRPMTSASHPELDSMIVTDRETDGARLLTGAHFSMADHRRDYPIAEQSPVRSMRNTYRLEPTAWDSEYVDMPVESGQGFDEGPAGYEAQAGIIGGRTYRLGG